MSQARTITLISRDAAVAIGMHCSHRLHSFRRKHLQTVAFTASHTCGRMHGQQIESDTTHNHSMHRIYPVHLETQCISRCLLHCSGASNPDDANACTQSMPFEADTEKEHAWSQTVAVEEL